MTEAETLNAEIASYETELDRLRSKLLEAPSAAALEFAGDAPANLLDSYRRAGLAQANAHREAEALRQAISHAEVILEQKYERLAELEAAQRQIDRLARVDAAKAEIESHIGKIAKLGRQIEAEILAVKELYDRANIDFRESQNPKTSANKILDLVCFRGAACIPTLGKEDDRFVLGMQRIDLFKREREQIQRQELERTLARSRNQTESREQAVQERAETQRIFEKQQLENEISERQINLKFLERQKDDASRLGILIPGQLVIAIARAAAEMNELENRLEDLQNDKFIA